LAGQVRVALGVPGDRGVAAGLPVLAGRAAERGTAAEPVRCGRVGPRPTAVQRVRHPAGTVTAPVVVVAADQVVGVVRVDRDPGLVLRLGPALQIRVGQVQAVLVYLDVVAEPVGARGVRRGPAGRKRCGTGPRGRVRTVEL